MIQFTEHGGEKRYDLHSGSVLLAASVNSPDLNHVEKQMICARGASTRTSRKPEGPGEIQVSGSLL